MDPQVLCVLPMIRWTGHYIVQCGGGMGQVAKRRQWAAAQEEGKGGPVDREGHRKKHREKGSIPSELNLPQL